jgi:thermitase
MRGRARLLLWLQISMLVMGLVLGAAPVGAAEEPPSELIVTLKPEHRAQAADIHRRAGGKMRKQAGLRPTHVVTVDKARSRATSDAYRKDPRVASVEPNAKVRVAWAPNDPELAQQWALPRMGVPTAWDLTTGRGDTLVAVVDTGVDAAHPDLVGKVAASANFSTARDAVDRNGHGTHVAGLIAAVADNGRGVAGVAPSVRLLNARALDDRGDGTYADVIEALDWAVDQGARIVNLSLAGDTPSEALAAAVSDAQARGVLVVAAAGNNGTSALTYPASLPGVLSVAALDSADAPVPVSTFGPWVRLGAPGLGVRATLPGGAYGGRTGSSAAAAQVSGVAALALAAAPSAAPAAIGALIEETAARGGWTGIAVATGRVDALAAVDAASERAGTLKTAPTGDTGWRLSASGTLVGPALRFFNGSAMRGTDGATSGAFAYEDRAAKLRASVAKVDALLVEDGRVVVTGQATVTVGNKKSSSPHRFRIAMREPRGATPAHATIEIHGPDVAGYAADADLKPGRVQLTSFADPAARRAPRPTGGSNGKVKAAAADVTVTVRNAAGTPHGAGLTVQVYNGAANTGISGVTNASGQVTFASLADGSYRFRVAVNGQVFFSGPANTCTVPACTSDAVVYETGSVTLTVRTSGGTPYAGLTVRAYNGATYANVQLTTDAAGQATFPSLAQGGYRFRATYAGQQLFSGPTNTCTVTACTTDTVVIDPTAVTVTVRNAAGTPHPAGITVQAYTTAANTGLSGTTNAAGQVTINLPPGSYNFRVAYLGQVFYSGGAAGVNTCTTPACTTDAVVFETGNVTLTVRTSGGTPYAGLTVRAYNGATYTNVQLTTDAAGQATFAGMPQGSYLFRATYGGQFYYSGATSTTNTCTVTACTADAVVFDPATVTVTVRNTGGTPYGAGITVLAYTGATNTGFSAVTNASGQAVFTLPPGSYSFRTTQSTQTHFSGATLTTNSCTVPGCTTDQIVYDTSSVTLTVRRTDGTPHSGLVVRVYNGATYAGVQLTTDAAGQATFNGLTTGSYLFRATYGAQFYYSGATSTTNTCTVPACATDTVVFDPAAVTVTVRNAGGTPHAGVIVRAYSGASYTGMQATTNASGQVTFTLGVGNYLFRAAPTGGSFQYSGATSTTNTCTVPGCTTDQVVYETSSVTVTVQNSGGAPYAGLTVATFSGATNVGIGGTTDAAGQVVIAGLAPGSYLFRATSGGQNYYSGATSTTNTCTTPACATDQVVFDTGSVTVTVQSMGGTPHGAGITVLAYSGATNTGLSAVTNASGQAVFTLSPGSYLFRTTQTTQTHFSGATLTTNSCAVPGCATDMIDYDVGNVTVTVRQTDGTPHVGRVVRVYNGATYASQQLTTNAAGQVTFTALTTGSYLFRATYGAQFYYSGATSTTNTCTVAACTADEVVFDPEPVAVTVRNAGGTPHVGVVVRAYSGASYTGMQATTNASGQVTFSLGDGNYLFRAAPTGQFIYSGATSTTNTCTVPGCATDQVVYDTQSVAVTVQTSGGSPHVGVTVTAFNGATATGVSAVTNASGQATLAGLAPGAYLFRATVAGQNYYSGATSTTNTCTTPACTTDQVIVDTGAVTVTVQNTGGTPYGAGITVLAYTGATNTGLSAVTNASGQVSFTLPPGSYLFRTTQSAQTHFSGATLTTNSCAVPGCATDQIVYDTQNVTVTVRTTGGTPYAGLTVRAYNGATYVGQQLVTNAAGQVTFSNLTTGSYLFRATYNTLFYYSGATSTTNTCTVTACSTDAVVIDPATVTVTVRDAGGTPYGAGLVVRAYNGGTNTGVNAVTNASGQAVLTLAAGSYRFRSDYSTIQFFSGPANTCTVPACTTDAVVYDLVAVTVTVQSPSGAPYSGVPVYAYNAAVNTTITANTNAAGQAAVTVPTGSYRFRADVAAVQYFSNAANHCTITGCTTATVPVSIPAAGDTFDRADAATLGGGWLQDSAVGWGICSNAACFSRAGYVGYAKRDTQAGLTDQKVGISVVAGGFDGQVGLITRVAPGWNVHMVWVGADAAGNVEVWTLIDGDWGASAIATSSSAVGYPLTLEAVTSGTTLTVRANGAVVPGLAAVAVPAPPANATQAGIYIDSTGATPPRIADFSIAP